MAITGPADSVGYPTTFSIDSIVADSGTPAPVADNIVKVRKLVFAGRVARRGEFVNVVPSDSALAQSVAQLLGNFRDFLPRLPADGVKPGAAWTDTVETTQKGSDATSSRRATIHATATPWERAGVSGLRVETSQTYHVTGSGKNAGQPYELSGDGTATGTAFVAAQVVPNRATLYLYPSDVTDARAVWVNPAGSGRFEEASLNLDLTVGDPGAAGRLRQLTLGLSSRGLSFGYQRDVFDPGGRG